MEQPVFFDASGKRRLWSKRILGAMLLLIFSAIVGLAATVLALPKPRALNPAQERVQARPISEQISQLRRNVSSWLPHRNNATSQRQIAVGFYVPWDPDSRISVEAHIGQLDWVVTTIGSVIGDQPQIAVTPDPEFDQILATAERKPLVLPMVQNARSDKWDGAGMARILANPAKRALFVQRLEALVEARDAGGIALDIEELPITAQGDYLVFLRALKARFATHDWLVTVALPVGDPAWNLGAFAAVVDKVFIMDYDEHSPGDPPGPVASQAWFVTRLGEALRQIPKDKAIVAIGAYGYDWHDGTTENMTVEECWASARESDAVPVFDRVSGNVRIDWEDDKSTHHLWLIDAAGNWNQLKAVTNSGASGVAIWRLGSEDPGLWRALASWRTGIAPDLSTITTSGTPDVEGNGELFTIASTPTDGNRVLKADRFGLFWDETYKTLPTPYIIQRAGDHPGEVALTFDDGPDPKWTPQILDILEREHVSATFFVIGENALSQPFLLNRIIRDGSELGSHSYTHPDLSKVSPFGVKLELNMTQRLVQAYTGRSMRLFRAPYFGDAEPTTANELVPALAAQRAGYLNVGLHVDPGDWKRPGTAIIINSTLSEVSTDNREKSQQIVLLHDGGGDREQTIAALPQIIESLKARGYKFVPASGLAGWSPDKVMPPVTGMDLVAVRADVGVFLAFAAILLIIKWLFFLAIGLGIARALLMTALALRSHFAADAPQPPPINPTLFVSVLIPAFNEAKVIIGSVRRVLASEEVRVEVIVIDDGSTDGTSDLVRTEFASESRVHLLTLANGGKARALNEALGLVKSDVIIALDADTQFEKTTVARLARWFADPEIGAVAGNAKVGNRVNIVTRWQAVEYVTAQNLERRALTRFDAITVVPGAVGAWRRAALDAVGGYPIDTLAEDQDLTIAIQRKGWRIGYDVDAVAWTEAPETLRALGKQRFRWAFGTLQCLWKHRAIMRERRPAGLAFVGIPQAWLFQIGFAMISPIIDLALVISAVSTVLRIYQHGWAQTQSDVLRMALYWLAFTSVDLICGGVAYWLEPRETSFPAHRLITQRFVYRQLMYGVVLRAIGAALTGPWVGWGKLERTGRLAENHH